MFLNESIESTGILSNEITMYEAVMEANDAYHNLCMQAVKYEHQAIVSEDAQFLKEAEEGFMSRAKQIAKTLYQKFISFINRVKAEWSKLYASVITKLGFDSAKVRDRLDNKDLEISGKVKVIDGQIIGKIFDMIDEIAPDGGEEALLKAAQKMKEVDKFLNKESNFKAKKRSISRAEVESAYKFLQERPKLIKKLEVMRSMGANVYKLTLLEIDKESRTSHEGMLIAKFTTIINKMISRINSVTSDAIRICKAALSNTGKDSKEEKKYKGDMNSALYGRRKL